MSSPISEILWHFTGASKSENEAFIRLESILREKTLKVGSYKESIFVPLKNGREEVINTREVCCVADIPIEHLDHHAIRYGQFAIGFRRGSLLAHPFNPVFYVPKESGRVKLNAIRSITIDAENNCIDSAILELQKGVYSNSDFLISLMQDVKNGSMKQIKNNLAVIMSYIKTFSEDEFDTIYAEREWRSTKDYYFEYADIEKIIVPKNYEAKISKTIGKLGVKINTTIWETISFLEK